MPFFPLSDDLNSDPRFVGLSDPAMALYSRAASWSASRLTDGLVPASMLPSFSGAVAGSADELVEAGVWRRARGGWQMVAFPDFAKKAAVEARRRADKQRQQRKRSSDAAPSRRDSERDTRPESRSESRPESDAPYTYPYSVPTERAAAPPGESVSAQTVTAAWVEATKANGVTPSKGQVGQVARTAKELLTAGNDPGLVMAAAQDAATSGYAAIDRSLTRLVSRPSLKAVAGERGTRDSRGRRTDL